MVTVVLADDHRVLRQGLRSLLEAEPDLQVVGEANNGNDVIAIIEHSCPDVLVTDLRMPGMSGIELARQVGRLSPGTSTVVLSMYNNKAYVDEALAAGAMAYVLKDSSYQELVAAIRDVLSGRRYVSPGICLKNLSANT